MTATYRYSADGVKLEAKVSSGTSNVPAGQPTAYAYLGSLVYSKVGDSYQLESTGFSGGRIVPGDTQHPVHYHIADHLGSVRSVVWPEEGSDGAVIIEQNDYYPYGLRMDNGLTASTDNRYRFSGKEAQPLMGGSILDFGARYYNPTIARWTTIDPKAEKYYSTTPYSYCTGNPVMYIDPDGEITRLYVQKGDKLGHCFVTVYEREKTTIYSYGRYGALSDCSGITLGKYTPSGEGVMFKLTGKGAANFLRQVNNEGNFSVYEFTDADDDKVASYYDGLMKNGSKPSNPNKKSYNDPNAKVIDQYNLFNNNCTTKSAEGLRAGGASIDSSSISPYMIDRDLSKQASESNSLREVDDLKTFIQTLINSLTVK